MKNRTIKRYRELIKLKTFEERFEYLKLNGLVGVDTFGYDRFLNQEVYKSQEWKTVRNDIIIRDDCCDLGVDGYQINGSVTIHHINPLTIEQIEYLDPIIFDPENLICTCHNTHNAIHYGTENTLIRIPKERFKNDTCPWKR